MHVPLSKFEVAVAFFRDLLGFTEFLHVRDFDALYAELKPKLDTLPLGDIHGPANKHYGQRELLILAPDGDLVCFGQAISKETADRPTTP
jgi:hypothetical protein